MATYRQGYGHTKTISALGPVAREDNTPLDKSEIAHFLRYLSYEGGEPVIQPVTLVEDPITTGYDGSFDEVIDIDSQTPGVYQYWYRTVDTDGRQSRDSEVLTLGILPPLALPLPPTELFI